MASQGLAAEIAWARSLAAGTAAQQAAVGETAPLAGTEPAAGTAAVGQSLAVAAAEEIHQAAAHRATYFQPGAAVVGWALVPGRRA